MAKDLVAMHSIERILTMARGNKNSKGYWKQLSLPFKNNEIETRNDESNNVISFSSRVKEVAINREAEVRKKSIDKLLSDAKKLKW